MIQGSDEWFAVRLGKVTASRVSDVVTKTKTGWGSSRANYMSELICERLTGQPAEKFTNDAMKWGTEHETEARDAYAWGTDTSVDLEGFIEHPSISMSGASPDGLIGLFGLVEIKCPNTATHIEMLLSGKIPEKYNIQMQWQLACSKRAWCDYVSYDPRLPISMRLSIQRIWRNDAMIDELEKHVGTFLIELDAKLCTLRSAYDLTSVIRESVA